MGRNVFMDFVKEHLTTKKHVDFGDTQERPNNIELEIMADTIYVKVRWYWNIYYIARRCYIIIICFNI